MFDHLKLNIRSNIGNTFSYLSQGKMIQVCFDIEKPLPEELKNYLLNLKGTRFHRIAENLYVNDSRICSNNFPGMLILVYIAYLNYDNKFELNPNLPIYKNLENNQVLQHIKNEDDELIKYLLAVSYYSVYDYSMRNRFREHIIIHFISNLYKILPDFLIELISRGYYNV